jgi:hypothetical protein
MTLPARWVGGLTVALGLWAALGMALADSVSAAPAGPAPATPGRPGAADSPTQGDRGPRTGTPDRSRASGKPAPARPSRLEPAPTKSAAAIPAAGRAATRVAAPESEVPVSTPPAPADLATRRPVRTPVVEPEQIPESTSVTASATPVPRLFDNPLGRRITIYQGTSFVIPNRWAVWVTTDSGGATFTADSTYDLKDEDQFDWNKLAGITYTPWRPDRNSAMVVWRYNLQSGAFEIGPFFNVDFRYVFPTEDEVITVPVDETFRYFVDYDGITVSYGDRTVYKATPEDLTPNFWTSARVTGWFGGSEVAPRTISYYQHR